MPQLIRRSKQSSSLLIDTMGIRRFINSIRKCREISCLPNNRLSIIQKKQAHGGKSLESLKPVLEFLKKILNSTKKILKKTTSLEYTYAFKQL
jgi:hypothetical protein